MTKIKICGLYRPCDIEYVNAAGVDFAGFILHFPKSHRNLTPERAAKLRCTLAPGIQAVGVFVDQPIETVLADAALIGLDVIQLHGHEDDAYIARLRENFNGKIWKAFIKEARESAADEILLDSGYGSGETFDWSQISLKRRFILAGGLTPENLTKAIDTLHPWCVDLSSGVETGKVKDKDKIFAAVAAVRKGN